MGGGGGHKQNIYRHLLMRNIYIVYGVEEGCLSKPKLQPTHPHRLDILETLGLGDKLQILPFGLVIFLRLLQYIEEKDLIGVKTLLLLLTGGERRL
jgi:hypothetical protein